MLSVERCFEKACLRARLFDALRKRWRGWFCIGFRLAGRCSSNGGRCGWWRELRDGVRILEPSKDQQAQPQAGEAHQNGERADKNKSLRQMCGHRRDQIILPDFILRGRLMSAARLVPLMWGYSGARRGGGVGCTRGGEGRGAH